MREREGTAGGLATTHSQDSLPKAFAIANGFPLSLAILTARIALNRFGKYASQGKLHTEGTKCPQCSPDDVTGEAVNEPSARLQCPGERQRAPPKLLVTALGGRQEFWRARRSLQ